MGFVHNALPILSTMLLGIMWYLLRLSSRLSSNLNSRFSSNLLLSCLNLSHLGLSSLGMWLEPPQLPLGRGHIKPLTCLKCLHLTRSKCVIRALLLAMLETGDLKGQQNSMKVKSQIRPKEPE